MREGGREGGRERGRREEGEREVREGGREEGERPVRAVIITSFHKHNTFTVLLVIDLRCVGWGHVVVLFLYTRNVLGYFYWSSLSTRIGVC